MGYLGSVDITCEDIEIDPELKKKWDLFLEAKKKKEEEEFEKKYPRRQYISDDELKKYGYKS